MGTNEMRDDGCVARSWCAKCRMMLSVLFNKMVERLHLSSDASKHMQAYLDYVK